MAPKLAAALLAPLLVAMVWPAPQPPARSNPAAPTTALASGDTASAPTSTASSLAWHGKSFSVAAASQAVETVSPGTTRARYPKLHGAAKPDSKSAAPTRQPRTATTKAAPKVAVYNNANLPGMDVTINGPNTGSPSDSTGAIGPNHYVEMVNSAIAVYNRSLGQVSVSTLQNWVGVDPTTPYCDPQIQWDPSSGRWLYAFLFCNAPTSCSSILSGFNCQDVHFGWSKTSDPTNLTAGGVNGWCHYKLNTGGDLFDFPKLGHNSKFMLLGINDYSTDQDGNDPPYIGSGVLWITKPANTLHTCPLASTVAVHGSPFPLLNRDGSGTFTPVPVNTTTSTGNGYVISAFDPFNNPQSKLAIWHLNSAGVWYAHPDLNVSTFDKPSPAPQLGTTFKIDTSDGRLTQAVGDPTTGIWTQHTVDGAGGRSVISWYEIKVSNTGAHVFQKGIMSSTTDFMFNAAISPRADAGGAAVLYNRSSATIDPVIAAQIRFTATPAQLMEPGELVLASSPQADTDATCDTPVVGTPCRWGDYSGASPDPVVKNVVWGTSQWNVTSQPPPAWATQNFALSFVTKPLAPTAVSALAGDGYARVSWTPNTYVPTPPVISFTVTAYVGITPTFTLVVAAPATTVHFGGLTDGVTYTFTVFATNSVGDSAESVHSNPVTPGRQAAQAPPPTPTPGRLPVPQSSPTAPPAR